MRRRPRSLADLLAANIARVDEADPQPVALLIPVRQPEGRYVAGSATRFVEVPLPRAILN